MTIPLLAGAVIGTLLFFAGCENKITGQKNQNQPPETTLFIQSDDTLNFTPSIQTLFWDGNDADGFVTGFFYTFAENPTDADWIWTTERTMTFRLQISGTDTTYRFRIKAVDNDGAEDPTPADQLIPIVNSRPEISWTTGSNIPDSTFTVAAFSWSANDPDGDDTIDFFEYSIDDTVTWVQISPDKRSLTLNESQGITPGDHAFYLRVVDIAGSKSPTIRMPENPNRFWNVKAPRGRYLLVDDYNVESSISRFPDAYYRSLMETLLPQVGDDYSYWNIELLFPASNRQFTETLKLFDRVIWYTDLISETDPHFVAAQISIPEFRQNGGKIIYTVQFNTGFGGQGAPLAFSPVDSLGRSFNVVPTNSLYYPDPAFGNTLPNLPALPELRVSSFILGLKGLVPKASSLPMYRYDLPNDPNDPIFVMAGLNDNTGEYDFVFSGTPLHFLRGNNNLNDLFQIILFDLFGP